MNLDWLIIGGGIHGVHLAARLLGEARVPPEQVRIVDPGEQLLERWRTCTATTGMQFLRSPSVHQLDLGATSLQRFGRTQRRRSGGHFAAPYDRPALTLFNAHCDEVIASFGLGDLHVRARVTACALRCDGVEVALSTGHSLRAQNVVLAIGASEQPRWPDWAPRDHARVHHVFEPGFDGWPSSPEDVVVVGGGISAGQVALRLLDEGHRVALVSRHALRTHQFDSDPGWLGPKFMTAFGRERDVDQRRALITKARHRGSVPPDVLRPLRRAIASGRLSWYEDHVEALVEGGSDPILRLRSGGQIEAARVLVATGFASHRPGGALIDELVHTASLPCARCGFPIVDRWLRWHPRIYVSGPLAELEIGPASRNIAGARRAGDRLVEAAQHAHSSSLAGARG